MRATCRGAGSSGVCAATLAACVVLRLVWVFPARYLIVRPGPDPVTGRTPPWTYTFMLGWAGMRGVVTLAAAFVIPEDTPHREVLLLMAFTVVAGTLFIQGMSLPWLAKRLRVPGPDPAEDALARATLLQQASKAALHRLEELEYDDSQGVVELIRQRLDQRNFAAWERLATNSEQESPSDLYARVRLAMLEAERERVLEIRSAGTVASEVVADVLALLDVEESMLDIATEERRNERETASARRTGGSCPDLERYPAVATAEDPVCQRCLDEGHRWVSLRQCLECGNVACCDSSVDAARHQALPRHHAPGDGVRRARRGLALVLRAPQDRLSRPFRVEIRKLAVRKRLRTANFRHSTRAAGRNRIGNDTAPVLPDTGNH